MNNKLAELRKKKQLNPHQKQQLKANKAKRGTVDRLEKNTK